MNLFPFKSMTTFHSPCLQLKHMQRPSSNHFSFSKILIPSVEFIHIHPHSQSQVSSVLIFCFTLQHFSNKKCINIFSEHFQKWQLFRQEVNVYTHAFLLSKSNISILILFYLSCTLRTNLRQRKKTKQRAPSSFPLSRNFIIYSSEHTHIYFSLWKGLDFLKVKEDTMILNFVIRFW